MRIIGIDPGETIGMCFYMGNRYIVGAEAHNVEGVIGFIELHNPDRVIMEDFILGPRPARAKDAIEQIGAIKYYCKDKDLLLFMQSPSALKFGKKHTTRVSNPSPHVLSACAHVVYYLHKVKK